MKTAICQTYLPLRPWAEPDLARLPGMRPIGPDEWLIVDEVYGAQMALRDQLMAERRDAVFAAAPEAASTEVLALVVSSLGAGYRRDGDQVVRPDGVAVDLRGDHPLAVAARLVQEDLCLLSARDGGFGLDGFGLDGAALLFPASWSLAEKLGRELIGIHAPVKRYDDDLARRVARLFTGLRAGRILMRGNYLLYDTPDLFHPATEAARRTKNDPKYLRVERQCLLRLSESGAYVFSIHTYVLPLTALDAADREALGA